MATIDGITIDVLRVYNKSFARSFRSLWTGDGYSYPQDVNWTERGWNIRGTLNAPTQEEVDRLEGLNQHGNPVLLDLDSDRTGFIQWVIVERFTVSPVLGTVYRFDMNVRKIPCIGTMYIQTDDIVLHDLHYRASYKVVDPLVGDFNKVWSSNRLVQTWEFYLDNDLNAIQVAILEIFACEDISTIEIWGWKDPGGGHAWVQIGDWGGAHAWNAVRNFTDDDAVVHAFQVQQGDRGDVLAGIGTISNMLGNFHRVLCEITAMQADAAPTTNVSTDHASYQLLLKAEITSTSRETLRPYPIINYITGGIGPTPA
jgi:hypothetical protein